MRENWRTVKLSDVCTICYGKDHKHLSDGIIPVYGSGGIIRYADNALYDKKSVLIPRKGTLSNLFYCAEPFWTVDTLFYTVIDESEIAPEYLYYSLMTMNLSAMNVGTAVPSLTTAVLNDILVLVPDLDEQQRIISMLAMLDDKIALNKKINNHLEQMAQAIFKSWFVDFEPWGGVMPGDWREGVLGEICSYSTERIAVSALTLDTYISTENMLSEKGGFVRAASLPTIPQTTAFAVGDTLISNIRPYFKKIVFCGFAGGCSTDVLCFRPNEANFSHYLYNLLHSDSFFDFMVASSKGTKMPRGDKQQIMSYHIAIPADETLNDFIAAVAPMTEKRFILADESSRLATLRDTLLPKLMSGEIKVII